MTNPVSTREMQAVAGNGSNTLFTFDFRIVEESDLVVIERDTDTNGVRVVSASEYSFTPGSVDNPSGGTVDFSSPPSATKEIKLYGLEPRDQGSDVITNPPGERTAFQAGLDSLSRQIQEINTAVSKAISITRFLEGADLELALPTESEDGAAVVWDNTNSRMSWSTTAATAGPTLVDPIAISGLPLTLTPSFQTLTVTGIPAASTRILIHATIQVTGTGSGPVSVPVYFNQSPQLQQIDRQFRATSGSEIDVITLPLHLPVTSLQFEVARGTAVNVTSTQLFGAFVIGYW